MGLCQFTSTIECDGFTLRCRDGVQMLPQKEFQLLYKLASYPGRIFTRQQLMDEIEKKCISAFMSHREGMADPYATDLFWYLWCGSASPLFGKEKCTTFESYFVNDSKLLHEPKNLIPLNVLLSYEPDVR